MPTTTQIVIIIIAVAIIIAIIIALYFLCIIVGWGNCKHATLALNDLSHTTQGKMIGISGILTDTISGEGLSEKTIKLSNPGGSIVGLPSSIRTGSIVVSSSPAGIIEFSDCAIGTSGCSPDWGSQTDDDGKNKLLRLSADTKLTFQPGTKIVKLFVQDTEQRGVEYRVVQSTGTTIDSNFVGAAPDIQGVVIIAENGNDIQELQILDVEADADPANIDTFGIAAIEISDARLAEPVLQKIDFEKSANTGTQVSPLAINKGSFFVTGKVVDSPLIPYEIQASFGGGEGYWPALPAQDKAYTLENTMSSLYGAAGEPITPPYPLDALTYSVITCAVGNDIDRDALCDTWEGTGGGIPYSGGTYNLCYDPAPPGGALTCPNTTTEDIFVEVDCMTGHCPLPNAINLVKNAFDVHQRDIKLHVLVDETNLTHVNGINAWTDPLPGDALENDFEDIKANHFGWGNGGGVGKPNELGPSNFAIRQAKANAYHYSLWVHALGSPTIDPVTCTSTSGLAEVKGNDMIISLGCGFGDPYNNHVGSNGTDKEQAGTFMHELGHNLGLDHGGPRQTWNVQTSSWDPVNSGYYSQNCKPNYPSVMSYSSQLPTYLGSLGWSPRYSDQSLKYATAPLPSGFLEENLIWEWEGMKTNPDGTISSYKIVWGQPGVVPSYSTGNSYKSGATRIPLNYDGLAPSDEAPQDLDVTQFGITGCGATPADTTLMGFDDWNNLYFDLRDGAAFVDGAWQTSYVNEINTEIYEVMVAQANQFNMTVPGTITIGNVTTLSFEFEDLDGNPIDNRTARFELLKVASFDVATLHLTSQPSRVLPEPSNNTFTYNPLSKTYQYTWDTGSYSDGSGSYLIMVYLESSQGDTLVDTLGNGYTALVKLDM